MKIFKRIAQEAQEPNITEENLENVNVTDNAIPAKKPRNRKPRKPKNQDVQEGSGGSGGAEGMSYFHAIAKRADELSDIAQKYLDSLPFIPDTECAELLWVKAKEIFEAANEDWDKVPEWVADSMDGYIPFTHPPSNRSLYVTLGHSVVAQSANLRMLLEYAYGRSADLNYFETLAEKEIVDKYTGM